MISTPLDSLMGAQAARPCALEDERTTIPRCVDKELRHIYNSQPRGESDWRSKSTEWQKRSFEQPNGKEYYLKKDQEGPPRNHRPVLMMAGLEELLTGRSKRGNLHSRNPVSHRAPAVNHSRHQEGAEWKSPYLTLHPQACQKSEAPSVNRIRTMRQMIRTETP